MLTAKKGQKEWDQLLTKIRGEYDEFIALFKKSSTLRSGFEQRYFDALHRRQELGAFLRAEWEALEELKSRELKEKQSKKDKEKAAEADKARQNITEKVLEKNLQKIEGYPDMEFSRDFPHEIKKLFGAMQWFERGYWVPLDSIALANGNSRMADIRVALETGWRAFTFMGRDAVPIRLAKYKSLLEKFPRDQRSIEWEERQVLFDAANFLGRIRDYLEDLAVDDRYTEAQKEQLNAGVKEMTQLLANFRLEDLVRLSKSK
ncbi:MAG: hypothetical protein LBQ61_02445 [Spirochaetales bacterium]|jgi:hypothetical protein|nr:hypothetical protein [Spirochaetales bacterium]